MNAGTKEKPINHTIRKTKKIDMENVEKITEAFKAIAEGRFREI